MKLLIYALAIVLLVTSCATRAPQSEGGPKRAPAAATHPVPMTPHAQLFKVCQYEQATVQNEAACKAKRELYQEYPSFQPAQLQKMAEEINAAYAQKAEILRARSAKAGQLKEGDPNTDGRRLRLTHSKGHACAVGELTIAKNVPENLRVGIFAQPGDYKTFSRFANGLTFVNPDADKDARSHSIKIIGAKGEKLLYGSDNTMDFVMNGGPVFIFKSPEHFKDFFVGRVSTDSKLWKTYYDVKQFARGDEAVALKILRDKAPVNLLEQDYYTGIPFRWGKVAAKVRLQYVTCPEAKGARSDLSGVDRKKDPDFYRKTIKQQLEADKIPACWNLQAQVQRDPWKQPIEDTTIEWKENEAPFATIAHLRIQPQSIDDERKLNACDGLSYNAWRVPAEMRPLGDISRLRGMAYYYSAKARREHNRVDETEPRGDELD